ncbi:unnamed protein product, partial [Mycena citricolor]
LRRTATDELLSLDISALQYHFFSPFSSPHLIMDTTEESIPDALSYDDTAYEDQLPSAAEQAQAQASLRNRIGASKVYLLSDAVKTKVGGKRKHGEDDEMDEEDPDMDADRRRSARKRVAAVRHAHSQFTHGPHLRVRDALRDEPARAGMDQVDDERCVLVFKSKAEARDAFALLQRNADEMPDEEGYVPAKLVPIAVWPPEERINNSLGGGSEMKGSLLMRWARPEDIKKRGARNQSRFYQTHGWKAGKEESNYDGAQTKRRRRDSFGRDEASERAALDAELDAFIRTEDDDDDGPPQPDVAADAGEETIHDDGASLLSKMRSDYITNDGRSLLERTSVMRVQPVALEQRLTSPVPRRAQGTMYADMLEDRVSHKLVIASDSSLQWGRERKSRPSTNGNSRRRDSGRQIRGERNRRPERSQATREDLDAELDAFLSEDKF